MRLEPTGNNSKPGTGHNPVPGTVRFCRILGFWTLTIFAGIQGPRAGAALYSIGNPTDQEQLYLEYINRARANPSREAARFRETTNPDVLNAYSHFNVDLDLMVSLFESMADAPPLSMNAGLSAAAKAHSLDMLNNAFQGHTGTSGSTPGTRISNQGYSWYTYGENVYASSKSVFHGHVGFEVDWGFGPGGMQTPAGHRSNIHNPAFREIGIGVVNGVNGPVGPQLVTQDLASQFDADPFVTGVAYYDLNQNGFYDAGEGVGGVNVTVAGATFSANTSTSGGYSVPVPGDGSYDVTFSAPGLTPVVVPVTVNNAANVKLDFVPPFTPPLLSGPTLAAVGRNNNYTFSGVGAATGYEWEQSRRTPFDATEGAENGLDDVTVSITGGYQIIANTVQAAGTSSFHLAHLQPNRQSLQLKRRIRLGASSELVFASRLRWATSSQIALAQVSTDDGATWVDVWSQAGNSTSGQETFTVQTVPLGAFADQQVLIRFIYDFTGDSYYSGAGASLGWYLDEIGVTGAEELTETTVESTGPGNSIRFTPPNAGNYFLRVRPLLVGRSLPWAPPLLVSALPPPANPTGLRIVSDP